MLSGDIAFCLRHVRAMKNGKGELHLNAETVGYLELVFEDLLKEAKQLERRPAGQVRPLMAVNDPKIVVFPIVARSIPGPAGDAS